ncbi:hypothetical protein M7I_6068 [Glarea lozoyensis 74030]|uniref:L-ornithine N(5)-monooxygenase n=1 Tax=Glarea lozoyensis (strain ATCC 74030 / MF5533) TaxID=1104152 RepID=H0ETK4_GLAL7|nr:hypothetical protein M7I_6068 [Glarea lozoyensis 74030]
MDHVLNKIKIGRNTSVAVIGGGLTSAQVTCAAINSKISKVYHLMRGPMKVKHFDADLSWVGKYRNFQQAAFWGAESDEERFEMITEARGGGNFTPEYKKLVLDLVKTGQVDMFENIEVVDAEWDKNIDMWKLKTEPSVEGLCVDHIVYATGAQADFMSIPALQSLREMAPIKSVNGLPCITNDLQWNEDIPFFFSGRFAGLRLGPFAANLEGARTGAERIAGRLAELCEGERSDSEPAGKRIDLLIYSEKHQAIRGCGIAFSVPKLPVTWTVTWCCPNIRTSAQVPGGSIDGKDMDCVSAEIRNEDEFPRRIKKNLMRMRPVLTLISYIASTKRTTVKDPMYRISGGLRLSCDILQPLD